MFEKLLKHLTNAPVAIALAFLFGGRTGRARGPDVAGHVGWRGARKRRVRPACVPPVGFGDWIVLVLATVGTTIAIIWLVDELWSMTNPEQEGMFEAILHMGRGE